MCLFKRLLLKINKSSNLRYLNSVDYVLKTPKKLLPVFYTDENNPSNHNNTHLQKIYTIPSKDISTLFAYDLPRQYKNQLKAFNELSLLIRKPSIELLDCLKQTNYTKPVNKYVLYGKTGSGKSSILYHMIHYGHTTNKIIVYVNKAQKWFTKPKEVKVSESIPNLMDLPIDASNWLSKFKLLNNDILAQTDIRIVKSYAQELQYNFQKNTPLIELIDFGINRARFACDMVLALVSELKEASTAGKCNVLVLIDDFNIFFENYTKIKNKYKKLSLASEISLTQAFLDITKFDWNNGQIIVTIDNKVTMDRQESHLPHYLLTQEGFDHLDPFLPINVENYDEHEFSIIIEYYKYKKWIRSITSEHVLELKMLSGGNPYKLMHLCKHL